MALDDASGHNGTGAGDGGGGGGGAGDEQSKEASPSHSTTANGGSGGLGLRSSSKPNAGKKCIVLKSPMGGEPMVYDWPLKKGKGSVRKSEVRDSGHCCPWIVQVLNLARRQRPLLQYNRHSCVDKRFSLHHLV